VVVRLCLQAHGGPCIQPALSREGRAAVQAEGLDSLDLEGHGQGLARAPDSADRDQQDREAYCRDRVRVLQPDVRQDGHHSVAVATSATKRPKKAR
jgi:hypothetical protein